MIFKNGLRTINKTLVTPLERTESILTQMILLKSPVIIN
jgi:hypothetical protein